jgi:hypothetical protein
MDQQNHVNCTTPRCRNSASYKIAEPWSYGAATELKTYGLACQDHFAHVYREARQRKVVYAPRPNESVGEIGIYRCGTDARKPEPERLKGLEASCTSWERLMQASSARPGS